MFKIEFESIMQDFEYKPNNSNRFEEATKNVAFLLGFSAHRPENEFGRGPDVVWAGGPSGYFVIECKSEATSKTICKEYCNQLNGSIEWFEEKYGPSEPMTPIQMHPNNRYEYASSPNARIRVVSADKFASLKVAIRGLFSSIYVDGSICDENRIKELLSFQKLRWDDIVSEYSEAAQRVSKE